MDLTSGYPFWLIKYGLPFDYKPLQKNIVTKVAVMGGGISGALAAYFLTEAGIPCVVFDERTISLGSTCASTSLLQYEIDVPLHELIKKRGKENAETAYRLCADAIDTLEEICKKINFKEFNPCDSYYYAASKKDLSFLRKEYEARKQAGFQVELLDESQFYQQQKIKAPGAIKSKKAATTNAYSLAHALLQYSISKGALVYDRTKAIDIKHTKEEVTIKLENECVITTDLLVYANGYESVNYVDKRIVALNSTYALCSEQMEVDKIPFSSNAVIWNTADPYLYIRTTPDGRVIIGGRDEKFQNPIKRDSLLRKKTKLLQEDFEKIFPATKMKTEFFWCGTFGATKDGLPFIGEYPKLPNSFFALGFGGNGITFSVIAAQMLANKCLGLPMKYDSLFSMKR